MCRRYDDRRRPGAIVPLRDRATAHHRGSAEHPASPTFTERRRILQVVAAVGARIENVSHLVAHRRAVDAVAWRS
jgi:hypothetical protein